MTNRKSIYHLLMLMACMTLCYACKSGVPGEYIRPGKMEDLLYEYFMADAMAMDGKDFNERQRQRMEYRASVLKKYDVTQAEFDSSLVYYFRHADRLKGIFQDVSKRMSDEAIALGSSVNDLNLYGADATAGDTATVWRASRTCVLLPNRGENLISFSLETDTAYYPGDKLTLQMDAEYIIQEGMKDGIAMLAITLGNDSVVKQTQHISSNTSYNMQIADKNHDGIKSVKGFVALLQGQKTKYSNTLRILCLSKLRLVRMHEKEEEKKDENGSEMDKVQGAQTVSHDTITSEKNEEKRNNKSGDVRKANTSSAPDTAQRKAFFGNRGSKIEKKK